MMRFSCLVCPEIDSTHHIVSCFTIGKQAKCHDKLKEREGERDTDRNRETEIEVKYGNKAVKRMCNATCVCLILLFLFVSSFVFR